MNLKPKPRTALRLGAVATAMTLGAVVASPSPAGAAPAGHGMAKVETTILDTRIANLLGVKVLHDVGTSVTNPLSGEVGGVANLTQLQLTSGVVGALNKTVGQFTAKQPGGLPKVTASLLDLNTVGGAINVPLLGGSVSAISGAIEPTVIEAANVPASATSHTASIVDAGLMGGLASVHALTSNDRTGSGTAAAEAVRNVGVGATTVLKLADLLALLGLDVLQLPIGLVEGLLKGLGINVALPTGATDLSDFVTQLVGDGGVLDQVQAVAEPTVAPVFGALDSVLAPLGIQSSTTVIDAVDTLQDVLSDLLNTVTDLLENASLLSVNALEIGTVAKAADTVAGSVATATARIGSIKVGNIVVPGLDITAVTDTVNSTLQQVSNLLNGLLPGLGLGDIVKLRLFDKNTSIVNQGGVIKAVSSLTGLHVSVNLPANITQLVNSLTNVAGIGELGVSGLNVPVLGGLLGGQGSTLLPDSGEVLGLDVVKIASTAEHAIPASATPVNVPGQKTPTSLPRTGGDSLPFGLAAAGMTAAAVAASRARRRSRENTNTTA